MGGGWGKIQPPSILQRYTMFKSIYIVKKLNASHDDNVKRVAATINSVATINHATTLSSIRDVGPNTLIVAVGGDGTMLEAMRLSALHGAVAVGVNLGKVGFLTDFPDDDSLVNELNLIFTSDITPRLEHRLMLSAYNTTHDINALAGNEVVVSSDEPDTMITYRMTLDGVDTGIHRANSVIISTPTGSTAYSLSAGGALLLPNLEVLQVVPVAPITLTSRPLVVSGSTRIVIEAWGNGVSVRRDGQKQFSTEYSFTPNDPFTLFVETFNRRATILHSRGWTFFEVLSSKLGWIQR